jgi:hypothetical protein
VQLLLALGGIAVGFYLFASWSSHAGPMRTRRILGRVGLAAFILLMVILLARGGVSLIWPLVVLMLPLLARRLKNQLGSSTTSRQNRRTRSTAMPESTVETRFLRMSLDHQSGAMSGQVISGRYTNCKLMDLGPEDLLALWWECQSDPQSVAVLEAYLDRTHTGDWRNWQQQRSGEYQPETTRMSRDDAYEVLGLRPGATPEEIKAAHRRLMQRLHPDHGGSTYLAARVNEAKDMLLSKK